MTCCALCPCAWASKSEFSFLLYGNIDIFKEVVDDSMTGANM